MHNKPHTEAAKAKMRVARARQPRKWDWLPEWDIVIRLLYTAATTRSVAAEYGCSDSTIKCIFRKNTTVEERMIARNRKGADKKRGRPNLVLAEWSKTHDVWTGRKHTEATKQKQSAAKKGKKLSLQRRIAQSARLQGISIEEWQGFVCSEAERLRRSQEYSDWRQSVFERDDWTCQHCDTRGGRLHAHHIKPVRTNPESIFDLQNGITLCISCHKKTNSYGGIGV